MITIADRLLEAMKKSNITQADLHRKTGFSRAAISKWVNGQSEPKDILTLARILDVSPDWLQFGKGSMANKTDTSLPRDAMHPLALTQQMSDELSGLVSHYNNAGDAKKASLKMLAALPEHEMSTMLLLLKSLSDKYKDAP